MTFAPVTPMSFARILPPRTGWTYDRVTWPNLPKFAETITFDRYNAIRIPFFPILRVPQFDPAACVRPAVRTDASVLLGALGMLNVPSFIRAAANGLGGLGANSDMTFTDRDANINTGGGGGSSGGGSSSNAGHGTTPTKVSVPPGTTPTTGGSNVQPPPGTVPEGGTPLMTTSTTGFPSWGYYVVGGMVLFGGLLVILSLNKKKPAANRRRRYRRRSR